VLHFTVRQVAAQLAVNHKLIRKLIKNGKLDAVKVGGAVRVSEEALQEYLASNAMSKPVKKVPVRQSCKSLKVGKDWFA